MTDAINIIVPLIEEGLDRRLIAFSEPWYPTPDAEPLRYETTLAGMPAVVELGVPETGWQRVTWVLLPTGPKGALPTTSASAAWPGEAWGTAEIDRRINFSVMPGRFHCRRHLQSTLRRLPQRELVDVQMSIGWAA